MLLKRCTPFLIVIAGLVAEPAGVLDVRAANLQNVAQRSAEAQAKFPVRVSEGIDPSTAAGIVARCAKAYQFLMRTLKLSPAISLEVLSRKDWTGSSVYGMPHFAKGTLTVAGEPNEFWTGMGSMIAQQNPTAASSLRAVYGGTSNQIALGGFFDLLVVHELGHAFRAEVGRGFSRLWLNEFYANLALEAYVQSVEPEALSRLRAFPRAFESVSMSRRTLSEFDGSMPGDNYAWYQALLHRLASEIYAIGGAGVLEYLTQLDLPADLATDADVARFFRAGPHPELARIVDNWPVTFASATQSDPGASSLKLGTVDPSLESGSPDGRWGVVQKPKDSGQLFLRDLTTGSDRPIAASPGVPGDFVWSLDSRLLAFTVAPRGDVYRQHAQLWVASAATAESHQVPVAGGYVALLGATAAGEWFYKAEEAPANGAKGPWTRRYFLMSDRDASVNTIVYTAQGRGSWPLAVTPDGKAMIVDVSSGLARYDFATGQQRPLGITNATSVCLSPDGRLLAYVRNLGGPAAFVSALDELPIKRTVRMTDVAKDARRFIGWWTANGRFVMPAVENYSSATFRIDVKPDTATARGPLTLIARDVDYPAVSPDGRRIAFSPYSGGTLSVFDAKGGVRLNSAVSEVSQVFGWRSPQVVLGWVRGGRLTAWDTNTGAISTVGVLENFQDLLGYVPGKDEIIYRAAKESGGAIKAHPVAGGVDRTITSESLDAIVVTQDGRQVAYSRAVGSGGPYEIVLATSDGRVDRRIPTKSRFDPAAWSPDARFVLVYDWSGQNWQVLDVATSATRPLLTGADQVEWESADYPGASWSPDGSFIALGGYQTWREPVGKAWSGVNEAVLARTPTQSASSASSRSAPGRTQLVFLGTGTPIADPDRFGPALAIVSGNQSYLVDAGVGIVRRAAATRLPPLAAPNLQRVFITHLHSDHTLGLPDLMFSAWTLNRQVPLDVYGPTGVGEMTAAIEQAWKADVDIRTGSGEGLSSSNYRALPHAIHAGRVYEDANVKVDAIPVQHGTWPEAFGYRFQTADRTIVVSGDTRPTVALADACNGCDVLVHEVYATRASKFQEYDKAFHTSVAELAELAKKARPRLLVLYHTLGAGSEQLIAQIRAAGYTGQVVVAQDLDVY